GLDVDAAARTLDGRRIALVLAERLRTDLAFGTGGRAGAAVLGIGSQIGIRAIRIGRDRTGVGVVEDRRLRACTKGIERSQEARGRKRAAKNKGTAHWTILPKTSWRGSSRDIGSLEPVRPSLRLARAIAAPAFSVERLVGERIHRARRRWNADD